MATPAAQIIGPKGFSVRQPKKSQLAEAMEKYLVGPWLGVRPDLVMHKGAPTIDGKLTYILEDPARGTHYEFEETDAQFFMCLLTEDDVPAAVDKLLKTTSLRPSIEDIVTFLKKLQMQQLAVLPPETVDEQLEDNLKKRRNAKKFRLIKILFFRIPLIRPDAILEVLLPWLSPFWSKPFRYIYLVLGLVGMISVFQQIELYWHTVNHLFTPTGLLTFMVCVYFVKVLHEFGHAFASKQQGAYVRRMGIYMMLFTPMLYSDTTDAWKIPSRRGRMLVGLAGVSVEFYVACISLFFWSVLPDGMLRSLFFYLSGASMVSTVMVNLNPFLRFDGYYILMDYVRTSNLRPRATLLFKHFLRRLMVDWQGPKPEEHPYPRFMVLFGFFCSCYMGFLIVSINMTVYYTISKLAGIWGIITGFAIFYAGGFIREIGFLFKNIKKWGSKTRAAINFTLLLLVVVSLFIPFHKTIKLPGLVLAKDLSRVEAVSAGRMIGAPPLIGAPVKQGDVLFEIDDWGLTQEKSRLQYNLWQAEETLKRLAASGAEGAYRSWLAAEKERIQAEYEKTLESIAQLKICALRDGIVADVNDTLRQGAHIYRGLYLCTIADGKTYEVKAYAVETLYKSVIAAGATGGRIALPDLNLPVIAGRVREVYSFPVDEFPNMALFDYAGGPIMTVSGRGSDIKPKYAHFPIAFDIELPERLLAHGTPCVAHVQGPQQSLVDRLVEWTWNFMAGEGFI